MSDGGINDNSVSDGGMSHNGTSDGGVSDNVAPLMSPLQPHLFNLASSTSPLQRQLHEQRQHRRRRHEPKQHQRRRYEPLHHLFGLTLSATTA
jgi:hypothetical protein